ncbi:unnamed protein product, partial [Closterium sp. Naga37s-1]
ISNGSSSSSSSSSSGGGGAAAAAAATAAAAASAAAAAAANSSAGGGGGVSVGVIIGIVVAAVAILLLLVATLVYFRHKLQPQGSGSSLAASHCTEFSLAEVLKATNGCFGVLMLVIFTGRPPFLGTDGDGQQITKWASECLSSGDRESLKDPTMDAPADAVLRVAQLALSCTAERTADRPSMLQVANELQAIREEWVGKEELSAAVKVDAQVQEMKDVVGVNSLNTALQMIEDNLGESYHRL